MDTQLKDDYMLRVFDRLTSDGNALFGLFQEETLIAVAGYTLFAGEFAMMGRLRSDSRYRKNGYGTLITDYIYKQVKNNPGIKWIGANTEQHNKPAQKVLKNLAVPHITTLYAAQTDDISGFTAQKERGNWQRVDSVSKKRKWLEKTYLNPQFDKAVFPLEAYYPLPACASLFTDDRLDGWICYENLDSSRAVFMWEEEKGKTYLHVVYPWSDVMTQPGLLSVIEEEFINSKQNSEVSTIWIDLTEEEVALLPDSHPFDLPSPWMLHGHFLEEHSSDEWPKTMDSSQVEDRSVSDSLDKASALLSDIEAELDELEQTVDKQQSTLSQLDKQFKQIDANS